MLACQVCQKKKIRCNRGSPCEGCSKAGVPCVPVVNYRLPRGRNGGRKKTSDVTEARLARLESLLSSLQKQGQVGPSALLNGDKETSVVETGPPTLYQYLGDSFWSTLGEEVRELGDMLQDTHISDIDLDEVPEKRCC